MSKRIVLVLALAALAAPGALGDEVTTKDGTTIKGVVVRKTSRYVFVRTLEGTERLLRDNVEKILENGIIGQKDIDEKVMTIDDTVPEELAGVAAWAKKEGHDGWRLLTEKVLMMDEDNETAHKLLGHVKADDKWFESAEEAEEYEREQRERKLRKKGYVPFKGGFIKRDARSEMRRNPDDWILGDDSIWYPKSEYYRSRGYVNYDGAWVKITPRDKAEMEEFKKAIGEEILIVSGEHFRLAVMHYDAAQIQEFLEICEQVYDWFLKEIGKDPDYELFGGNQGRIFVFKDTPTAMKWYEAFKNKYGLTDSWHTLMERSGGNVNSGKGLLGNITLRENKDIRNQLVHQVGHFCISNFCRGLEGRCPAWLREGWAHMAEHVHMGNGVINCSTLAEYAASGGVAEKGPFSTKEAPDLAKGAVREGASEPFVNLTKLKLNRLDSGHLAKGWTIVEWLRQEHRDKFVKWMLQMNLSKPVQALQEAFGWMPSDLDEKWLEYIKRRY